MAEILLGKIKGEKGDPFTFDDLTPEQKEELKGEDGRIPEKGVDYWTEADKSEIRSYIDQQLGVIENGSY